MEYYQITGDECLALNKKNKLCVLDSKIKIYDADYKLLKKYSGIKYPYDMKVDDDENKLYVSTTENYIHVIDLESLEIVDTITIDIYPGSKKKNGFAIGRMTLYNRSIFIEAVQRGEVLILKYNLEKKSQEIIFRGEAITEIELEEDTLYSDSNGVYILADFGKKLLNKCKVVKNKFGINELQLEETCFHLCDKICNKNGARSFVKFVSSNFTLNNRKKYYYAEKKQEEWKFEYKERLFGNYKFKYFKDYECVAVCELNISHPNVTIMFFLSKDIIEQSYNEYIDCTLTNEGLFLLKDRDEDIDTSKQYSAFIPFAELGLE